MFQVFIVHDGDQYFACSSDQPGTPKDLYLAGRLDFLKGTTLVEAAGAAAREAFALEVSHITLVELNDVAVPEPC